MPYAIRHEGGNRPYKIIKTTTGKVVGTSKNRADAQASIRARFASERGGRTSQAVQRAKKQM